MDQLFLIFDNIKKLSPALRAYLQSCLKRKEVKKGEIILREGQVAKHIYFIEEGIVRSIRYKKNKERTLWIMRKNDLFVSVRSFFSQKPAIETIEALKDCVLHYISFEELEKAYDDYPEFDRHGRKILQNYYELSEERNDMRDQSAYDRFVFLMTHQPELVEDVSDFILASYLSMTREHFSVQKRLYAKRNKKK
ncbi:cyclic nucleotide-binding domain-containing protein [Flavitalea sp. BT771]|uniref:Crp/Fnr family transcriptional regulator n=1 Tax=Flavitalea sp. BT771 TaxID=3063329 RepID=UPI0026E38C41|nr:cyclic nucleotide-binding domain-containing protein [Flavitalea sp. BT771]MDO6433290.1 cyclic nucleotide-binding domain-containing protein [Flavitalea sp. BT771]MDV6222805.1 cyclic nucleotide-binding domain-containing protein [Flavitalea sp. BT771]